MMNNSFHRQRLRSLVLYPSFCLLFFVQRERDVLFVCCVVLMEAVVRRRGVNVGSTRGCPVANFFVSVVPEFR